MKKNDIVKKYGKPQICIMGLNIWILGREFPESKDYEEGNWLNVIVECEDSKTHACTSGPLLVITELEYWGKQCCEFLIQPNKEITLISDGFQFWVDIKMNSEENLTFDVHMYNEEDEDKEDIKDFYFQISKLDIEFFIEQIKKVLIDYPIVNG